MNRGIRKVPFGHVEETDTLKGTLVYYDTFQDVTDQQLRHAAELAKTRSFKKLVLYPLHEETARRMWKRPIEPYYVRENRLFDWRRESEDDGAITVENWEGKRKKYTPIEAALRHLADVYPQPMFLYVTPETANAFASFSSFEEWIGKIRLIISEPPPDAHPNLTKYRHRWDVEENS
ncbi:hypothetical protein SAMN05216378_1296 [Paenibacillus catalpae]|uniref:Nicotinic acid mononucleotide adenylyltransferase n=1 Tax=Paenibacillus catalpae TaxID=1045775 RepID=A0A1I1V1F4_9BACL|nr:hypothetical protein [Paenibacillus catalpae]SFD75828.1 hypothetical protein SAMN05216378_1296 [Paenibacillus catalpae]